MKKTLIASLFRDRAQAERIVHELRRAGVPDSAVSVVSLRSDDDHQHRDHDHGTHGHGRTDEVRRTDLDTGDGAGAGVTKGVLAGGAVGAIAGLGALLIPGVGPFIAGGALAQALGAAGSAAVVSGAVGAAAGGLSTALVDYGVDSEHARYAEERVRDGGVLVTVDTSSDPAAYNPTRAILSAGGGEILDERRHETTAA